MTNAFQQMKQSRDKMFETLNKQIEEQGQGNGQKDARFWYPQRDEKTGNGYAVIRFLPPCKDEETPSVQLYSHGFKGPGGWYIENSRTTLFGADGKRQADPVSDYNREQWQRAEQLGGEAEKTLKKQVSARKRNGHFIGNIQVLVDKANPENEGKSFLYRWGPKIQGKIEKAFKPDFEDKQPFNPFDFWGGADFILRITTQPPIGDQKKGFPNYDESSFKDPSPLFDGDENRLMALWESQHSLQALIAPDQFKSFDELKAKLNSVLRLSPNAESAAPAQHPSDIVEQSANRYATNTNMQEWSEQKDPEPTATAPAADYDEDIAYFRKMAEESRAT